MGTHRRTLHRVVGHFLPSVFVNKVPNLLEPIPYGMNDLRNAHLARRLFCSRYILMGG
jgi:hypothetical protein